jgi:hypothetical protein
MVNLEAVTKGLVSRHREFHRSGQARALTHSRLTLELARLHVIVCILGYPTCTGIVRDHALAAYTEPDRRARFGTTKGELVRVGRVLVDWPSADGEGEGTAASRARSPVTPKEGKSPSRGFERQNQTRKEDKGFHGEQKVTIEAV